MGKLISVNPRDSHFTRRRYILAFGAYGWTQLMVWANCLDDALDECIDWIVENAPGLLADAAVNDAYTRAIAAGIDDETAHIEATQDTISGGNAGNYLLAWEVHIVSENPSRALILELQGRA
jgi:hypothetical protein